MGRGEGFNLTSSLLLFLLRTQMHSHVNVSNNLSYVKCLPAALGPCSKPEFKNAAHTINSSADSQHKAASVMFSPPLVGYETPPPNFPPLAFSSLSKKKK